MAQPYDEDERRYLDTDGTLHCLESMCQHEPEWAASRIRVLVQERDEAQRVARELADYLSVRIDAPPYAVEALLDTALAYPEVKP